MKEPSSFTPPQPLDFVEAISAEASAIREDWSDPRGSLRLIQEYCDKLREQLSETAPKNCQRCGWDLAKMPAPARRPDPRDQIPADQEDQ